MRRKPFLLLLGLGLLLTALRPVFAGDTKEPVPVVIIVTDSAGATIPYAQVKLAPQQAMNPKNPETDETGKASLNVIPGKYDLFVTAPDYAPWAKNVQVEATARQTVTIVLQIANTTQIVQTCSPCPLIQVGGHPEPPIAPSSSITIAVADATGAPVPYAQIGVNPKDVGWQFHEADESGKFSLKLVPGTYEFAVTSPGFKRWSQRIELKEKENQTLSVILQVGGCLPGPCNTVVSTH